MLVGVMLVGGLGVLRTDGSVSPKWGGVAGNRIAPSSEPAPSPGPGLSAAVAAARLFIIIIIIYYIVIICLYSYIYNILIRQGWNENTRGGAEVLTLNEVAPPPTPAPAPPPDDGDVASRRGAGATRRESGVWSSALRGRAQMRARAGK